MKKSMQLIRTGVQLLFLALFIAGLYMNVRMVIIILLPATILFGNFFCGWVCPYGTIQELFAKFGSLFIKKKFKMPKAIQKYLQFLRYIIMVVSATGIAAIFFESINAYMTFLTLGSVANIAVTISLIIMISFLLISMFFERPYCNYVCVEAGKYGVLSMARIFSFKRKKETCIDCKKCDKVCPMNISISDKDYVRNGQCINCFKCSSNCPKANTLEYKFVGWKKRQK